MNNIPLELDWVTERAKCTPFKVFETLRCQVDADLKTRNALTIESGVPKRTFVLQGDGDWFAVTYMPFGESKKGVMLKLTDNGIDVFDIPSHGRLHEGILVISDDGQCRLKVQNIEYNMWQFRKLALQEMFFVNR